MPAQPIGHCLDQGCVPVIVLHCPHESSAQAAVIDVDRLEAHRKSIVVCPEGLGRRVIELGSNALPIEVALIALAGCGREREIGLNSRSLQEIRCGKRGRAGRGLI